MDLDGCVDCDGTCSGLDVIGSRSIPHDEIERQFDDTLKKLPSERYAGFMNYLQQNHSTTYKIFRAFGF
jgi:hypothetical protein